MQVSKHVTVTTRRGRVVKEDEEEEQQKILIMMSIMKSMMYPMRKTVDCTMGVPQFKFRADMTPEERLETQRWKEEERQKERQRQRQHVRSSSHGIPVGEAERGCSPLLQS